MMWFLRLFSAFRLLEVRLIDAQSSCNRAEQEIASLRSQCLRFESAWMEMHKDSINAVKTLANATWQTKYGTRLYEDVPGIPEARVLPSQPGSVAPGKLSVRIEQEAAYNNFRKEAEQQWETAHSQGR